MKILLVLSVSSRIKEIVDQGLELITDTDNAITSVIIQLLATLLLFLIVRFFFWNKITKVLEEKENNSKKAFEDLENAKKEASEIKEQIAKDQKLAKETGYSIIEKSKEKANLEAEEIIKKAKEEANRKIENANEEIKKEINEANEEIKKEIISTAYCLAEKIIEKEIDEEKHDKLVKDFMNGDVK